MSANEGNRERFELSLPIDAAADDVWRALTDSAELTRWFPLKAQVEAGEGGKIYISWGPVCEGTARITAWEPPHHFQWTEDTIPAPDKQQPPVEIVVDFFIESHGGQSVVRVVQSGFGPGVNWDEYYDSISRGWKFELRGLRHYLQHHRGTDRNVVWVRQRCDLDPAEIARRVLGPEARLLRGELAGRGEGDGYELRPVDDTGPALRGVVQVNGLPKSFAGTVDDLNRAYFRFEIEQFAGGQEAWLWLSTYGVSAGEREQIEQGWRAGLERALE